MRRHNAGFTLIELLIVVVIIGLLAAIAVPKFSSTKEKAYTATMKGDLHNLATAQEAYWSGNSSYYNGTFPNPLMVYNPSVGVTVTITVATAGGWAATASHANSPVTCALFAGPVAPPPPATIEGRIACQ